MKIMCIIERKQYIINDNDNNSNNNEKRNKILKY